MIKKNPPKGIPTHLAWKKITWGGYGPFSHFNYEKYLPKGEKAGPWLYEPSISYCEIGFHVCETRKMMRSYWQDSAHLTYRVEVAGKFYRDLDKSVYQYMRFIKRTKG